MKNTYPQTLNIAEFSVVELKNSELNNTNGGVPWALIGAYAAAGATGVGIIIVGAAVGYGVYKLVDWATS
jgi:hypothetical protein